MKPTNETVPFPSSEDLRSLGSRIAKLRSAFGWRQVELSRRSGIDSTRLSRIENGRSVPRLGELVRLRDSLGTDLEEIVFGEAAGLPRSPGLSGELGDLKRLLHYLIRGFEAEHGRGGEPPPAREGCLGGGNV